MSIVARRGRVIAEPRSRLLRFDRSSIGTAATAAVDHSDAFDPRHELARLALDVVVRTAEPACLPRRWSTAAFGREVDRTRTQLAPIHSRDGLIASFSREGSIAVTTLAPLSPTEPPGPVRVAYAIRWLELGDDRLRGPWSALVEGPVREVAAAIGIRSPDADELPERCEVDAPDQPPRMGLTRT